MVYVGADLAYPNPTPHWRRRKSELISDLLFLASYFKSISVGEINQHIFKLLKVVVLNTGRKTKVEKNHLCNHMWLMSQGEVR